jgi:branched-chain amino acid transport system permease protein
MSFGTPQLVIMLLNGLVIAANLFIIASGLSIIFGVSRISNFAHGSLYMLGAYIGYSATKALPPGLPYFALGVAGAALVVGAIGFLIETTIFRRIYNAPHHLQLIATFGIFLILQDMTFLIWGPQELFGARVPGLSGAIRILGRPFPEYNLVILGTSVVLLGLLTLLFHKTRWGVLLRAATQDRDMVAALGVDQKWLFTTVFLLGSVLAGLAGALQVPRQAANLGMDLDIIIDAFAVVVIGGMGSIPGCFLAAILVGLLEAFGSILFSHFTLALVFVVMAVVLVIRPKGFFGKHSGADWHDPVVSESVLTPAGNRARLLWIGLVGLLVLAPVFAGGYVLDTLTESIILVLFAYSFYFMAGPAGMMSFGQAAYFAIGLYTAALLKKFFDIGMVQGLILGPAVAAAAAIVFGWFCVRMSGIYLAMLTLAVGQIIWAVAFQWLTVTNGDNGILGVWPDSWAAARWVYYYLALALCVGGILVMRRIIFAPFGYGMRAGRDSVLRSEAIGIDVARQKWIGFVISGVFAGLAGTLMVYLKGSAFPAYADIQTSFDALLMALLGGLQTLNGPIVGAVIYRALKTTVQINFDRWHMLIGVALILLVLFMPRGLKGVAEDLVAWRARGAAAGDGVRLPQGEEPAVKRSVAGE